MQRKSVTTKVYPTTKSRVNKYTTKGAIQAYKKRTVSRPNVMLMAVQRRGSEIKAIDIANAQYNFLAAGTPPTLTLLNGIQTGAGFFNRIGARVELKSLKIRGQIFNLLTSVISMLRMIVIYDKQPNGAAPAITEIFQSRDQTGAAATSANSEINLDQRERFVIVRDKEIYAPPVTNTAGVLTNGPSFPGDESSGPYVINEFIPLKGMLSHYKTSSSPTTIADINTGALYVTFITTGAANSWAFTGGFRLRFDDN